VNLREALILALDEAAIAGINVTELPSEGWRQRLRTDQTIEYRHRGTGVRLIGTLDPDAKTLRFLTVSHHTKLLNTIRSASPMGGRLVADQTNLSDHGSAERLLQLGARVLPQGDRWLEEWRGELYELPTGEHHRFIRHVLLFGVPRLAIILRIPVWLRRIG
jgi:hypothetical protein